MLLGEMIHVDLRRIIQKLLYCVFICGEVKGHLRKREDAMQWFRTIFHEIFGLFVEDGSFAIAILVWLAIVWLLLPHLGVFSRWNGLILFAGLACILVESTLRYARKSDQAKSGKWKGKI